MAVFFQVVTWGNVLLLLGTWGSGYLRPEALGPPDAFHMPLGLLSCVITLLIQAYFFSFLLTSTWDVDHVAGKQGKSPEAAAEAHRIKARCVPVVMVPALTAVVTGIVGMAARAMVVGPSVHGGLAALLTLGAIVAAVMEPKAAEQLEGLLEELGLSDEARMELGNR